MKVKFMLVWFFFGARVDFYIPQNKELNPSRRVEWSLGDAEEWKNSEY